MLLYKYITFPIISQLYFSNIYISFLPTELRGRFLHKQKTDPLQMRRCGSIATTVCQDPAELPHYSFLMILFFFFLCIILSTNSFTLTNIVTINHIFIKLISIIFILFFILSLLPFLTHHSSLSIKSFHIPILISFSIT